MKSLNVVQLLALILTTALALPGQPTRSSIRGLGSENQLSSHAANILVQRTILSRPSLHKRGGESPPRSSKSGRSDRSPSPPSPPSRSSSLDASRLAQGPYSPSRSASISVPPGSALRRLSDESQRPRSSSDRRMESRRQHGGVMGSSLGTSSKGGGSSNSFLSSLSSSPGSPDLLSYSGSPMRSSFRSMEKHTLSGRLRVPEPTESANKIPSPGTTDDLGPMPLDQTLNAATAANRPPTPFTRRRSEPPETLSKMNLTPANVRSFMAAPRASDATSASGSAKSPPQPPPSLRRLAESGRRASSPTPWTDSIDHIHAEPSADPHTQARVQSISRAQAQQAPGASGIGDGEKGTG